ncbi:undecaprenyldiphospho-muramoylpentapeptide beta-N-acetylglucosaminyltransferase [Pueribacillus theae]|uniref:UDP-N-acetylglucosamine--N-acetylmuramyl-(pentapeptide) pyrophosphoryl-undecaprenol N-acetylglucosamine transferase n=1 Tax=Pueribacillus theae TaxID=2171751 RepID=A0A2U1JUY2_9BACI|nr:undecaprenyldiphospho-muramoylpentapeptide beta-N-acetylglucosaminyltransferase [Pueribacillus theae]PWA09016.1 undecaprenyldiphospho-muramoylpentapeptide beta-N-acetylglucosaminyltransferase [Pueribacillus theae]
MRRIVLTGGGTAGHVTPNLALIPKLQEKNWDIHYIGSKDGIEKTLIEEVNIPYYPISSGKLRRYFDIKNFQDPFKVLKGIADAYFIIRKLKPEVIFSKGGFVSVPVVIAGKLNNVPVLIHESDYTPGLANKIAGKFATKMFVTFKEAEQFLPKGKVLYTGSPIREEILKGSKEKGLKFLGFDLSKPVITIMGGSLGSVKLNTVIRDNLETLLEDYQIVHLCGKGNIDDSLENTPGYRQFEYVSDELPDIVAATDFVVSRAGSNAIFEWLALKKPMLLIPLSRAASRGDQLLNADSFQKQGFAAVLEEEELTNEAFMESINELYANRDNYIAAMETNAPTDSIGMILNEIEKAGK